MGRSLARAVRALAVVVVGAAWTFASVAPASAHAVLLGSDPADGSVLDAAPDHLTLTFDEPVSVPDDGVTVLDAAGDPVASDPHAVDSTVQIDLTDTLDDGTYVVSWRVVSQDSHPVAGAFSFSVGAPSAGAPVAAAVSEPSTALENARRAAQGLAYVGIFGVAGLALFDLRLLEAAPGGVPRVRRRLRTARAWLGASAAVGLVAGVPLTVAWQDGGDLGDVLTSSTMSDAVTSAGARPVLIAAVLGVLGVGLAVRGTRAALSPSRARGSDDARAALSSPLAARLALAGAGVALESLTVVGHTRTFGPAWLVLGADAVHVVAGAVWLGSALGLTLLLARGTDASDHQAATTVARFSTLGAWVLVALSATGLLLGWRILGSLDALVTTGYGVTLLVKVAVALVVVAVAAWNRYRLVPRLDTAAPSATSDPAADFPATEPASALGSLRRTVTAEAVLLVVVLAVTGVLTSQSPRTVEAGPGTPRDTPGSASASESPAHAMHEVTEPLGDGSVVVHVTPGAVGVNAVEITLLDADGNPVDAVADPELAASLPEVGLGPLTPPVARTGVGEYVATLDMPLAGAWEIELRVRTSKYTSDAVTIPLEVQ